MTNIIKALLNIKNYGNNDLSKLTIISKDQPRVNKEGDRLDGFIKDAFCNSFHIRNPEEKMKIFQEHFSYLGSQNNPPDIIIKNSDAIEVKKVGAVFANSLQLNSSMPKSKLKSDSSLLNSNCRNCEKGWREKDIVYAVGHVEENKLKILTLVYGDCYAADEELYEEIRQEIIEAVKKMNLNLSETRELGRINNVDPLERASLRIRGMWIIKTPIVIFSDIMKIDSSKSLNIFALMTDEKFNSFEKSDSDKIKKEAKMSNVAIKNPNNPKKNINAKLIHIAV